MKPIYIKAPAKLNLRLKITGRRDDGYHLLSMLNTGVTLYDEITLSLNASNKISVKVEGTKDNDLNNPKKNLAARAADAFLNRFAIKSGVEITLLKNIPVAAGLGGGSSDAAAVLKTLAHHFSPPDCSSHELIQLALTLGADVPYFLTGSFAHVTGVGEIVRPLSHPLKDLQCSIFLPSIGVETAKAYALIRKELPVIESKDDQQCLKLIGHSSSFKLNLAQAISLVENDFEGVVCAHYPEIKKVISNIRSCADIVCGLSGSGSSVFALPRQGVFSERLLQDLKYLALELGTGIVFAKLC